MEWVIPGYLARGRRPGYAKDADRNRIVDRAAVGPWVRRAGRMGIRGVLCLLTPEELRLYDYMPGGLRRHYQAHGLQTAHVPMRDSQAPTGAELEQAWRAYERLPKPVLVHCSGGEGRTGAVVRYLLERLPEVLEPPGEDGAPAMCYQQAQ